MDVCAVVNFVAAEVTGVKQGVPVVVLAGHSAILVSFGDVGGREGGRIVEGGGCMGCWLRFSRGGG